jgi:hypothetical protein
LCRRSANKISRIDTKWRSSSTLKTSHQKKISSQAKILIELIKKQPLTEIELVKNSRISRSQFYRVTPILIKEGILKKIEGKPRRYVINVGTYKNEYVELDDILRDLTRKYVVKTISLADLAHLVGKPPKKIEDAAYELAKKYHIRVGPETVPPLGMKNLRKIYK